MHLKAIDRIPQLVKDVVIDKIPRVGQESKKGVVYKNILYIRN